MVLGRLIMLIDKNISKLNQQGELFINLHPYLDVKIKIGTWEQGLPFYSEKNGQWIANHYQSRITLLTNEHLNNKLLPINHFLQTIPHWIVEKSMKYRYRQFNLLQTLSKYPSAVELFESAPNLLWLMVIEKENQQWSDEKIEKLLLQKRSSIINILFPGLDPLPKGLRKINRLKFINKIQLHDTSKQEFELIKQVISSINNIRAFYHWQKLPIHILAIIQTFPKLLGCRLLEEARQVKPINLAHCIGEYREVYQILLDIERMVQILDIKGIQRHYESAKSKQSLLKYHDRLVEQINKDPVSASEYQIGFPEMPFKGTTDIVYIKNVYDLITEGQVMKHCVSSYIKDARQGISYFFKVLKPQRATLQLGLMGNDYEIRQFKLKSNNEPSDESWHIVRQWLKEAKEQ